MNAAIADLHYPARVVFGRGALELVGELARGWSTRSLVVTDRGMRATGLLDRLLANLAGAGIETFLYEGVEPNPTAQHVEDGLVAGAGRGVGVIISLGGGSAHDTAKMIALIAANGGSLLDYVGVDRSSTRSIPLVAVNTTAGSGAEVSRYAVITDPTRATRMIVSDRHLVPGVAVEDPLATVGLPPEQTMATGIDALTHAIEAVVSVKASAISDLYALRAIELIRDHLPRVVRDGTDLEAREAMMLAALLAGYAINAALAGAVHALAHAVGAVYDLPHGICNGLLLPAVVEANLPAARQRYARVVEVFAPGNAPEALPGLLRRFGRTLGLPSGLRALGVEPSRIPALAEAAVADLSMTTNPRPLRPEEVVRCYERSL